MNHPQFFKKERQARLPLPCPLRSLLAHLVYIRAPQKLLFGQILLDLAGFDLAARSRRHFRQGQNEVEVVIARDTIEALSLAAQAMMYNHILAVWTLKMPNGFH